MEKERVDLLVVQQGLTDSREKAKRLVMAGQIVDAVKHIRYDKPGEKIPITTELYIKGETLRYVSRGGLKLEKALATFDVSVEGKILLDIGASTGGFTDAALQHGAVLSYALDVGYNQLDYKLRQDERVEVMERVNFRFSKPEDFTKGKPQVASIDVSFISLSLILPNLSEIIKDGGEVCALVKPQFEAGREKVGKGGIVRDKKTQIEVVEKVLLLANSVGFSMINFSYSPITGGEGNIEFLMILKYNSEKLIENKNINIEHIINNAHNQFK